MDCVIKTLMENDLESWLRYYLAQNYSPEYLKTYLIRAGYDERTVDDAINRVLGREPSQTKKEKLNKKKVLISLLVLYLIILCGNFFYVSKIEEKATKEIQMFSQAQSKRSELDFCFKEFFECSPAECVMKFAEEDCRTFVDKAKESLGNPSSEESVEFNCHVETVCDIRNWRGKIVMAPYFGDLEFDENEIQNGDAYTKCVNFLKKEMPKSYFKCPNLLSLEYITTVGMEVWKGQLRANVWNPALFVTDFRRAAGSLLRAQQHAKDVYHNIDKLVANQYHSAIQTRPDKEIEIVNNCYTRMFENLCSFASDVFEVVIEAGIKGKIM